METANQIHDDAATDSETGAPINNRSPPAPHQELNVPPDGGYGWVCVGCVFWINAHTWGINSSYGVFLAHYLSKDTFPGATALDYAFVGGLSISTALLLAPLATFVVGKYGTKVALLIGIFLETAGLLGASFATEIWHLFLSQGVAFGSGMGFLFVASVGVVPQWFLKRRSFANSISTAGSGFGGLIYSLVTDAMIRSVSVAWAFRTLAIISCAVNIICTILVRDRNKHVGSVFLAFHFRLFMRPEFLLLLGWGVLSMLGYIVLLFSLPDYALSVGLTTKQGSVIAALMNLGQALGRPAVGYFSDAFGRINMAGTCTFLAGLFSLVIWIFAKSYGVLIFFTLLLGTVLGTFWTTIGPVGAEVVGIQILPSALSIVWIVLVLPCTFSEPIGLKLRVSSGNIYLHAQIYTGIMYIAAAMCLWFLRAWKIAELEKAALEEKQTVNLRSQGLGKPETSINPDSASAKAKAVKGLWSWQRV